MANSPVPAPQRATRRISWDVIRVVAVLAVVLGHVTHQSKLLHPELAGYPFVVPAQFGAAILLAVSAFFVCASLRKGRPARWLWNKIARLLPAYLIAVVITYLVMRIAASAFSGQHLGPGFSGFMFLPALEPPSDPNPWYVPNGLDLFSNIFMIEGWSPHFQYLDGSYWTLPVQIMAFSAAALLWPRRWRTDQLVLTLVWVLVVGPLVLRFLVFDPTDTPLWANTMIFGLGLHRVHSFAIGVAIWLWSKGRLATWHLGLLLIATIAAEDLQMFPLHHPTPIDPERLPSIAGFTVLLLMLCAAAKGRDWNFGFLRPLAPAITWLAGISYGIYLVHQELGYMLARTLVDLGAKPWERLILVLTGAVLGGWLLTVLVERPMHRLLTRTRESRAVPAPSDPENDLVTGHAESTTPVSVGGSS